MDQSVTHDPVAQAIGFTLTVAGKPVPCRVTEEWLRDAYGSDAFAGGALPAFLAHRAAIEATALRQWLASGGVAPVKLKRSQVWRQGSPARPREPASVATG